MYLSLGSLVHTQIYSFYNDIWTCPQSQTRNKPVQRNKETKTGTYL